MHAEGGALVGTDTVALLLPLPYGCTAECTPVHGGCGHDWLLMCGLHCWCYCSPAADPDTLGYAIDLERWCDTLAGAVCGQVEMLLMVLRALMTLVKLMHSLMRPSVSRCGDCCGLWSAGPVPGPAYVLRLALRAGTGHCQLGPG